MITLKVNVAMNGRKKGDLVQLATDSENNIINDFWARRLKDAEQDNCVEIVKEEKTSKGSK